MEPLPQLPFYLFKDVTCHPSVLQHAYFWYLFPQISKYKMGDLERMAARKELSWKPSRSSFWGWGPHPLCPSSLSSPFCWALDPELRWYKILQLLCHWQAKKACFRGSRNVISVECKLELLALHSKTLHTAALTRSVENVPGLSWWCMEIPSRLACFTFSLLTKMPWFV